MSIELIDKIKPKNNGSFSLVDACDVEMGNGERLEEAMQNHCDSVIPGDGVLKVGILYFLGEVEDITVSFPTTAKLGDIIYFSFISGSTPTILNITTDNYSGLDNFYIKPNFTYELMGMWNGIEWIMVKHEVM